jgi:predicted lipoprotein with Yx(FWY)xxD motif
MALDAQRRTTPRRHRTVLSALTVAGVAGMLAACASTGGTTPTGGASSANGATTLSTRQLSGVGTVLVDASGMTVYSPDQEAAGTIRCTADCLSFWFPVIVSSSAGLTLPSGLGGVVSTIRRPDDGQMQVTYNGKPLYTFKLDQAPGQDHGANFSDGFNGTDFTWRTVNAGGASAGAGAGTTSAGPTGPTNSSGYGYGTGGYGSGY